MKEVLQTRFGRPGGNCYQAAMASLMNVSLEEMPDFCNIGDDARGWFSRVSNWCIERGLAAIYINLKTPPYPTLIEGLCILGVRLKHHAADDTMLHAVVGRAKLVGDEWRYNVVHDPHPEKPEIAEVTDLMFVVKNVEP